LFIKILEEMEKVSATSTKRGEILLLIGGVYHEFERYAEVMTPVFRAQGHSVTTTDRLDALNRLDADGVDVVLMYTCIGGNEPLPSQEAAALDALAAWVQAGGRFLAAHAATTTARHHAGFAELAGGVFIEHPPQFAFQVIPLGRAHPVTEGLTAFGVFDEFYIQSYAADVEIHLVAADRGVAYPMTWTRAHGAGRVANVALGHSERVWQLPAYQQLMAQTVGWLMAEEG
jgi:type 1 glutamine amidotransferase